MYFYTDGELDVSTSARGNVKTNDEPLYIGANAEVPGREWNGWIDDVRVYNYALSEAEIKAIYEGRDPSQK